METDNHDEDAARAHIKRVTAPIFNKVLKEAGLNSMTTNRKSIKIFWRPNNYRRKIAVRKKCYSTIEKIKSAIPDANINSHTKLVSIKGYKGITIQYGKDKLIGIYSQPYINGEKTIYMLEAHSINDIEERLQQKRQEIEDKIDRALKAFIKQFNIGLTHGSPKWDRYEDFIKGDDYIDSIPRDTIIHDTYFKKVYGKGIEFIQSPLKEAPVTHIKNYIKDRAINDIAPEIAGAINRLAGFVSPLKYLKSRIMTVEDLIEHKEYIIPLSQADKLELEEHLFNIY